MQVDFGQLRNPTSHEDAQTSPDTAEIPSLNSLFFFTKIVLIVRYTLMSYTVVYIVLETTRAVIAPVGETSGIYRNKQDDQISRAQGVDTNLSLICKLDSMSTERGRAAKRLSAAARITAGSIGRSVAGWTKRPSMVRDVFIYIIDDCFLQIFELIIKIGFELEILLFIRVSPP